MGYTWTIHLLGQFYAEKDEMRVEFSDFPLRLMEYLAFHTSCDPDELFYYVYNEPYEKGDQDRYNKLRSRVNRDLFGLPEGQQIVLKKPSRVRLNLELTTTDVLEFKKKIKQANQSPPQLKNKILAEAVEFYQGDLLPGRTGEWVERSRVKMRKQYTVALHQLIHLNLEKGAYYEAFDYASQWIDEVQPEVEEVLPLITALWEGDQYARAIDLLKSSMNRLGDPGGRFSELLQRLEGRPRVPLPFAVQRTASSTEVTRQIFLNLDQKRYTAAAQMIADLWLNSSFSDGQTLVSTKRWPSTGAIGEGPVHFSNGYSWGESEHGRRGYALNTSLIAYSPIVRVRPESRYLWVSGWAAAIGVGAKGEWADRRVRGAFTDTEQIGGMQSFDSEHRPIQTLPICFPGTPQPEALKLADTKGVFNGRPSLGQIRAAGVVGAASLEAESKCEDLTEAKCDDRWIWLTQACLPEGTRYVRFQVRTFNSTEEPSFRHAIMVIGSLDEWESLPVFESTPHFHLPQSVSGPSNISLIRERYKEAIKTPVLIEQWRGVDKVLDLIWEARNDFQRLPEEAFQEIVHDMITLSIQRFDTLGPRPVYGDVGGFWRRIADLARHTPEFSPTEIASWYKLAASIGEQDPQFTWFYKAWIAECYERSALLHITGAEQATRPEAALREAATSWGQCAETYAGAYRSIRSKLPEELQKIFSWEADFLHSDKTDMRFRRLIEREILNLVEGKGN